MPDHATSPAEPGHRAGSGAHPRWLLLGLACLGCLGDIAAAADQVLVQRSAIARLAESMVDAEEGMRWLFADTLLQVAVEAYDAELASARREAPADVAHQAKLRRWLAAAGAVRDGLVAARLRLSEGAQIQFHVDDQGEVFLFIDGRPYAASAPRPDNERSLQAAFVGRFCTLGDCSALDRDAHPGTRLHGFGGSWTIAQNAPPSYGIDGLVRCDFADLERRHDKVERCLAIAADLGALRAALLRARTMGYLLDWEAIRRAPDRAGNQGIVRINGAGDFLRLALPVLARLDPTRWASVVDELRRTLVEPGYEARIDWIDGGPSASAAGSWPGPD
jgi:hypothetical protein